MRNFLAGILLAVLSAPASAQFCAGCIHNSAAPEEAQFNVSSATIRGKLTLGSLSMSSFTATSVTAGVFTGSGTLLTDLNASQLLSGIVASARLVGAYTGITSVGDIVAGSWKSTAIGTQYGGTGRNFVNVSTGSIIYFDAVGHTATLSPGDPEALLQTNGSAAPVWTSSPSVSGVNLYGIALTALKAGTLPTNIIVTTNSIPAVNGTSVVGDISGAAGSYLGPVTISQIVPGILPNDVTATSITVTGIAAGTYGDSSHALQIKYGTDGRASTITVLSLSVPLNFLQNGTLPAGVTVPAANINAGALGGGVVASSLNVTGVTPGVCGGPTQLCQISIAADGRISSATQFQNTGASTSTVTTTKDNNWISPQTFQSSITVEAAGLFSSSVTAAAFFGDGSHLAGIIAASVSSGGVDFSTITTALATKASSGTDNTITRLNALSTIGAAVTSLSSMTNTSAGGTLVTSSVTAGAFFGDGSHLLGIATTESNTFGPSSKTFTGAVLIKGAASFGVGTTISTMSTIGSLAMASGSSITLSGSAGYLTGSSSVTASAFFGDASHVTGSACRYSGTISGGLGSSITCGNPGSGNNANSNFGVVSGGINNVNSGIDATIGGGVSNSIANNTCTISGGNSNNCNGDGGAIGGGDQNHAGGGDSVVPGGSQNTAGGNGSFAAGTNAQANQNGAFVWADNNAVNFNSQASNTFNVRSQGGTFFNTSSMTVTGSVISQSSITATSSMTASAFFGDGLHLSGVLISGVAIPPGLIDLSTVTTALATKASTGTDNSITRLNALATIGSAFTVLSSMTNTSSGGLVVTSSVTAGAFFGDGSHLIGVSATESNTFTSSKTFTNNVLINGILTGSTTTLSGSMTMVGSTLTFRSLSSGTTAINAIGAIIAASTFNATGTAYQMNGVTVIDSNRNITASTVTASFFYGNGAGLTSVSATESNTYTSSKTFTNDVLVGGNLELSGVFTTHGTCFLGDSADDVVHIREALIEDGNTLTLTGGAGGTTIQNPDQVSGTGGDITIFSGSGIADGVAGGQIVLSGGNSSGADGGAAGLFGGATSAVGSAGGALSMAGGSSDQGNGGAVNINGGAANSAATFGGNVNISGGNITSGATGGNVTILPGDFGDSGTGTVFIGTMSYISNPPDNFAICLSGGQIGHCTSVVGINGSCTCVAP